LEASSIGRPVITVNSIGCRDAVDDGITGFVAQVKDTKDLFDKMHKMTLLSHSERVVMGENGRKKIEREFDQQVVISKYLEVINLF
jgi:glycosyltransferase involved in cell wall biosynthesis